MTKHHDLLPQTPGGGRLPCLLVGDLNCLPEGPVVELLTKGRVEVERVRRKGVDCSFLDTPGTIGLTPSCKLLGAGEEERKAEPGVLAHDLELSSVHGLDRKEQVVGRHVDIS